MNNEKIDLSVLETLSFTIQVSNRKERVLLFEELDNVLIFSKLLDETNEVLFQQLFNALLSTLSYYNDKKSRFLVFNLIQNLLKKYKNANHYFIDTIYVYLCKINSSSLFISRNVLTILRWLCLIDLNNIDVLDLDKKQKLINSHSIIISLINEKKHKIHVVLMKKYLDKFFEKKFFIENYLQLVTKTSIDENHLKILNLWEFLFEKLEKDNNQHVCLSFKKYPFEILLKYIISSKIKIILKKTYNSYINILRLITLEEFEDILPSIEKSILRSAETFFPILNCLLENLQLDLDKYAESLGKNISSHLYSSDENLRNLALSCIKNLVKKCKKKETIEFFIKYLTNIYIKSEPKLTLAYQKAGVLSALSCLSELDFQYDLNLIELACQNLFSFMKNEVHEQTLVLIVLAIKNWCIKLENNLSKSLIEIFVSIFNLKTSTPFIKSINIGCIKVALNQNSFQDLDRFNQTIIDSFTKGISSNLNKNSFVVEALFASNYILKRINFDQKFKENNNQTFKKLFETDQLPFLSEKFLISASIESLLELIELIKCLLLNYHSNLNEKKKIISTLLLLMNSKTNRFIRTEAINAFKLVNIKDQNYIKLATNCFLELYSNYNKQKLNLETSDTLKQPAVNSLITCLKTFNCIKNFNNQNCLDLFLPCHIVSIYKTNNLLWLKILKNYLEVENVQSFIETNLMNLVNLAYQTFLNVDIQENCIKTLVNFYPEQFLPIFVEDIVGQLRKDAYLKISRKEYEIFLTPDNELYDVSVLNNNQEQFNTKNLKKENKLYSYKEQLEEINFRKELESKKKPELSKKQQDAKKIQLEKENEIRTRIKELEDEFNLTITRLNAIINGNPLFTSFYLKDLIPCLINLFPSYLCAKKSVQTFLNLHTCVKENRNVVNSLVKTISFVIIKQFDALCDFDEEWNFELDEIEIKLLDRLNDIVFSSIDNEFEDNVKFSENNNALKPTTFAYVFPFLTNILNKRKRIDEVFEKIFSIITNHVIIKFENKIEELDDLSKNPIYLPRKDLAIVLLEKIEKDSVIVAKQAQKVFLQLSNCLSNYSDDNETINQIIDLIINKLNSESLILRNTCLDSLSIQSEFLLNLPECNLKEKLIKQIWISQFDSNQEIESKASDLWITCNLDIKPKLCLNILDDLLIYKYSLLEPLANSIEEILNEYNEEAVNVLHVLFDLYKKIAPKSLPKTDEFGRPLHNQVEDNFVPRLGIALILMKIAKFIPEENGIEMANFFVYDSLKDINDKVSKEMLMAGIALIHKTKKDNLHILLKVFENYLDQADNSKENDKVRAGVVVLTGSLAGCLDKNDTKIKPIIAKLIETLSTPSQMVQESVAFCIPALVPALEEQIPSLIEVLSKLLLDSDNYGEKKGAAYGIAGIVKGCGILSIKKLGIIDKCKRSIQHKKTSRKLGALIAIEVFCNVLNNLFEPYVIKLIPSLFICFGDSNENIRKATNETSKVIMNKLSAYGVKFILPSLLDALNKDNWRTKVGSVELLGTMAYCAPKQLSSCLPSIVPRLMELVCNSHPNVQKAANDALKQIGQVIRNTEVQSIVPVLLNALDDPANKTATCLETMLNTKFIHFIDAPSLALIMPVIERAFQARSTKTRKMAAQIIGNMYSLTDQKDLSPYLSSIIPGIKQSLLDPVPDVRAVTARALGAMVKGMGENIIDDILPWLMKTLISDTNSVDRSGAAQGLSEVIGGLGLSKLHKFLPDIIATTERTDISPYIKDGYLMLYIYLPIVFTQDFAPYIGRIINPILKAFADENEFVRETAFKAGQRIVSLYANTAIQLLLPELEKGLFDENWRIRYSSVQLLGDLLYKISGVTGKMTTETVNEDDNFGTEKSFKIIQTVLGEERRNRVLSGLYMGRLDVSHSVRQVSLHVWKVVVYNTSSTLKEILSTLITLLLGCLASKSYDQQQVAARTLGDIVQKLGRRILPQLIPILEKGLQSDRSDQRQGVCIGLSEIVSSTSKEMVEVFVESLVPTVTKALYDPLPEVRHAAGKTFDSLYSSVGVKALDEILPALLDKLDDKEVGEYVLDGIKQMLSFRSKNILPYLIPKLTVPPVNIRALSFLSSVTGDSLSKHLFKIMPALISVLSSSMDTEEEKQNYIYVKKVLLSINDENGARDIIEYLLNSTKSGNKNVVTLSVIMLNMYCCNTTADLINYVPNLIRGLINLLIIDDEKIINNTWEAFSSITKSLSSKELIEFLPDVKIAVQFAFSDYKTMNKDKKKPLLLPGFCWSKGIAPILPYIKEGLIVGNPEQKNLASICLTEIIKITNADGIKPSILILSGALIRILGDRFAVSLKITVMETITLLLEKVGPVMKQFMPQLQQSFLKSLNDPNRTLRLKAANALSYLIGFHPKCDAVINEICLNLSNSNEDIVIKETLVFAIRICLIQSGSRFSSSTKSSILQIILTLSDIQDESFKISVGACLGSLCKWLPVAEFNTVMKNYFLDISNLNISHYAQMIALRICLKECPEKVLAPEYNEKVIKTLLAHLSSDKFVISINGVKETAYLILYHLKENLEIPDQLLTAFTKCMKHGTNEVKQNVAFASSFLAKSYKQTLPIYVLKIFVPMLVNGTKENNSIVKSNSEQALVTILDLRKNDDIVNELIANLEPGPRESFQTCINKTLRRIASNREPNDNENFDETLFI